MKRFLKTFSTVFLAACTLWFVLSLFLLSEKRGLEGETRENGPPSLPATAHRKATLETAPASPAGIAGLFGWKMPVRKASAPVRTSAADEDTVAGWLSFVGEITGEEGRIYFFKNRENGKIVKAGAPGNGSTGWTVTGEDGEWYFLHDGENKYKVPKRGR